MSMTAAKSTASLKLSNWKSIPRWKRWLIIVVLLLGVTFFLGLVTVIFGQVHGTEFSPNLFERRDYWFLEVPLVHIQVRGQTRTDTTGDLERYLVSEKLVTVASDPAKAEWHLVRERRGGSPRETDVELLLSYLNARDHETSDEHWLIWSKAHPELAKILWPAVQEVAGQHLYLFLPDMFSLAKSTSDPAEFSRRLDDLLVEKFEFFGHAAQELGYNERANELFDHGIARAKQNPSRLKSLQDAKQSVMTTPEKP